MMLLPPPFSISAVLVQMPGALLFLSFVRAALTSAGEACVMEQFGLVMEYLFSVATPRV